MILNYNPYDPEFRERLTQIDNDFSSVKRDGKLRERLRQKTQGLCVICHRSLRSGLLNIGHATSRKDWAAMMGVRLEDAIRHANSEENLFLIHHACNIRQGSADLEEFLQPRSYGVPKDDNAKFPTVLTVRVDKSIHSQLGQIAKLEDRDISYLIRKAIEKFIEGYSKKK